MEAAMALVHLDTIEVSALKCCMMEAWQSDNVRETRVMVTIWLMMRALKKIVSGCRVGRDCCSLGWWRILGRSALPGLCKR